MNLPDSLTEIGQRMTSAKIDPVTIADVIAVINKGFALEMKNLQGVPVLANIETGLEPGSKAQESTTPSGSCSKQQDSCGPLQTLSQTQVLHLLKLGLDKDILRAASDGLETAVPDYTND